MHLISINESDARNMSFRDAADLEVLVVSAEDLTGPDPHVAMDSYVRVFLLPDKSTNMQTRVSAQTHIIVLLVFFIVDFNQ